MKYIGLLIGFSIFAQADVFLKTTNAEVALAAVQSYAEGHYRYIQDASLLEADQVDQSRPSCILESNHMSFHPQKNYRLLAARSLDIEGDQGEIELTFETHTENADAYFMFYCFQNAVGATLDTARSALKGVFQIDN
jgi:hypothetical protein